MTKLPRYDPERGELALPTGHTVSWERNEAGGRTYITDEVSCGVNCWDTALVLESTLLAALYIESLLREIERHD